MSFRSLDCLASHYYLNNMEKIITGIAELVKQNPLAIWIMCIQLFIALVSIGMLLSRKPQTSLQQGKLSRIQGILCLTSMIALWGYLPKNLTNYLDVIEHSGGVSQLFNRADDILRLLATVSGSLVAVLLTLVTLVVDFFQFKIQPPSSTSPDPQK